MGSSSCSQPQPAMDNGVRDGRFNCLVAPPTQHRAVPPELHVLHSAMRTGLQITRLTALREPRSCALRNARPTNCLCGHSRYRIQTIRSNRHQDLVNSINNLPKFSCYIIIICFSFYNNVENEIISIINVINNKNRNALINVTESIYSSNSYIRKVKKVKSSMAKSLPVENLLPQNVGSIINYLQ